MGTYYRITNPNIASIGTSYNLQVITSTVTQIVISTGYRAIEIVNIGPSTLVYGDSSITASSGGMLFYSMNKVFNNITGTFSFYMIADATNGTARIIGYKA